MHSPPRSARLAAWGNAWLSSQASLPDVLGRVVADDAHHDVRGLAAADLPLERAVPRLRADGVTHLRVVLPVPGDVTGLPGPGPFTRAALAMGEGALALRPDGTGMGLVPVPEEHGTPDEGSVTTVTWEAHPVQAGPDPGPWLADAEHELQTGLLACVRELRDLDVARWRPEVAGPLADLRQEARRGLLPDELPAGYPRRAHDLLVRARQLQGVIVLAAQDGGGATDTREAASREAALRQLAHVVRRAQVAAYNAYPAGMPDA